MAKATRLGFTGTPWFAPPITVPVPPEPPQTIPGALSDLMPVPAEPRRVRGQIRWCPKCRRTVVGLPPSGERSHVCATRMRTRLYFS